MRRTDSTMPPVRSLLFVVNPASGGRQGRWLVERLRERLGDDRIAILQETDLPALARVAASRGDRAALVACGGDGTAAAVIEAAWLVDPVRPVAVGVIPLGTGNDLARSLGWSHQLGGLSAATLDHLIHQLQVGTLAGLDRWLLTGAGQSRPFYNYCSLGADARIAARFHHLRRQQPWLFRSPAVNKLLYAAVSFGEPALPIARIAEHLDLPPWTRSAVFANIPSYAGGTCLGEGIRSDDGWIDGFALGPGASLALAASGVRKPIRFARTHVIQFAIADRLSAQIDGEPMTLSPSPYTIAHGGRCRVIRYD